MALAHTEESPDGAPPESAHGVRYRAARQSDGAHMWRVARDSEALELNTAYAYLVVCRDFGHTCAIAELDGQVVGYVLAYRPPREPDVVFVWQIGVDATARGLGIARSLLHELIRLPGCEGVRYLETTVTPSNQASRKLFASFARHEQTAIDKIGGFAREAFPQSGDAHEAEERYRIGPFVRME